MNKLCDIDAHATAMSESAQKEVAAVLAKRRAMDEQGEAHKPLVVLSGEFHTDPRGHIQHLLAIDGIRKAEPRTGVAYEYEHNRVIQEYALSGRILTLEAEAAIAAANDRGALSLRTSYRPTINAMALHSRAVLFRYVQRSGLPFVFNDCARPNNYMIDFTDAATAVSAASYYASYGVSPPSRLCARTEYGVGLRNVHMVDSGIAFAQRHKLRILFQQCGYAHVLGNARRKDYNESMAALLKQDSAAGVFAIASAESEMHYKRQDSAFLLATDELYFRPEIKGVEALYNAEPLHRPLSPVERREEMMSYMRLVERTDDSEEKELLKKIASVMLGFETVQPVHLENRKAESGYVNKLLSALGRDRDRMSVRNFRRWQAENTVMREKIFAACEQAATAQPLMPAAG